MEGHDRRAMKLKEVGAPLGTKATLLSVQGLAGLALFSVGEYGSEAHVIVLKVPEVQLQ